MIAEESLNVEVLCVDMIFEVVSDYSTLRAHQLPIIFLLPSYVSDLDGCQFALVDIQFVIV